MAQPSALPEIPKIPSNQAKLLWLFACEPGGYIEDIRLSFEQLFSEVKSDFDTLLEKLQQQRLVGSAEGDYFQLTYYGLAALVLQTMEEGASLSYEVEEFYMEEEPEPQAVAIRLLTSYFVFQPRFTEQVIELLDTLCETPLIWKLIPQLEAYTQREMTFRGWWGVTLGFSGPVGLLECEKVLPTMRATASMPIRADKELLGLAPMGKNDPFRGLFSYEYSTLIWTAAYQKKLPLNLRLIIDLSVAAIYQPELVGQLEDKVQAKYDNTGVTVETLRYWSMVFGSAEQLEEQFNDPQDWLETLISPKGETSWGAMLLELLALFRLSVHKPEVLQQFKATFQQEPRIEKLLAHQIEQPLVMKVQQGIRQILHPEQQLFWQSVNPYQSWLNRL